MKRHILTLLMAAAMLTASAQSPLDDGRASLRQYFAGYTNPAFPNLGKITVEDIQTDPGQKTVCIRLSANFAFQPVTPLVVGDLYAAVGQLLPEPFKGYRLTVMAGETPIEQLIPTSMMDRPDTSRIYKRELYKGNPWVTPMSLPYTIKKGLQGRHLTVWQSHGRYFSHAKRAWVWQRPSLFCTIEDLLTQTFMVPYLIPMLENAGAVVFTPRERDWQKREVIVDNDLIVDGSRYEERVGKVRWQEGSTGFGLAKPTLLNGENPFRMGTYRAIEATKDRRFTSEAVWMPDIQEEGDYAVYVSYQTLPNSIPDALYTVHHGGVATKMRVNQQMGGGTWVYLGTYHFTTGRGDQNCVVLSNQTDHKGVVTADAVRFGGGMGNVLRCDSLPDAVPTGSGLPRCLEAARYSAQWYGFPDSVYSPRGNDDYSDDINSRTFAENFLTKGSAYLQGDSGLCVPMELSLAMHSDAGFRRDNTLVGTLGVYTTGFYDNLTGAGLSRLVSRDLTDMVITQICRDMERSVGEWSRRDMWDRNYGETRDPQVPAMILEMFSHQNWADMRLAHDPHFKFLMSRAVYKGVLRFLATVHGRDYVVQPLPVAAVSAVADPARREITVGWTPRLDTMEPTATPGGYIIYIKEDGGDFDNGHYVDGQECRFRMEARPGTLYSFRVAAVNEGGRSMLSDEACAAVSTSPSAPAVLIVDAFQRLASPLPFDTETTGGFDFDRDPGVIDVKSPGFCGHQLSFDKSQYGRETSKGFGFSGSDLEGMILAGNTHDYSSAHARDIHAKRPEYTISSSTPLQLPYLDLRPYAVADLILGAQKDDGYSLTRRRAITPEMRSAISQLTLQGTSILVSGAYAGSDLGTPEDAAFVADKLKYRFLTSAPADSLCSVSGLGSTAAVWSRPNEAHYWIPATDVIEGLGGAFSTMKYLSTGYSAAIAYPGTDYRVMAFGFPLECITDTNERRNILDIAISYLIAR